MNAYSNPATAYPNAGDINTSAASNPYVQTAPAAAQTAHSSPALAFILGWIPGVGAIYNGQYVKGLVHALIFGLLVTMLNSSPSSTQPMLGILMAAFIFYMPFEALHTATARNRGLTPDEWSSILPLSRQGSGAPIGPIVLIAIGVVYLLNTLDLLNFHEIARYWPVLLIIIGAWMLYNRLAPPASRPRARTEQDDLAGSRREQ